MIKLLIILFLLSVVHCSGQEYSYDYDDAVEDSIPVTEDELIYTFEILKQYFEPDVAMVHPIYIKPSERLRIEANRLELQEKHFLYIREIHIRLVRYGLQK